MQFGEIGRAHIAFHDLAALVHQVGGGGDFDVAPIARDGAGVVQRHLEGQAPRLRKVQHVLRWVVAHGHGNRVIALALVFFVGADQFRHFCHAGGATGGPEIHQRDLAVQVLRGLLRTVEQHESRGRRHGLARSQVHPGPYGDKTGEGGARQPFLDTHVGTLC